MPHSAASCLGLHYLPMSHKKDARLISVNTDSIHKYVHALCMDLLRHLTLSLVVSSADNLCKQFGPRPGPTKRWA